MRLLWLISLLAVCAAPGWAVVIVRDGKPAASVVLPKDATASEREAAGELVRYVKETSGAELPVVSLPGRPVGVPIRVGRACARLPGQPEGIALRAGPAEIDIAGGSDRATLFAVYRFLEQALGCRWLAPNVEYVPRQATLDVPALDLQSVPAFDLRLFNARTQEQRAWGMKMGMNGFYAPNEAPEGTCCLPDAVPGCHAYARIMPASTYFQAHPEWFPLVGGRRQPGRTMGSQLCVTAPGLVDEFAKRVNAVFDADPRLQVCSISPNDGRGWCECDACLALDKKLCGGRTTRQGLAADAPFMGDRVFWFANQVAERVEKAHPGKLLLVLAYVNYAEPPDTIKPAANIVPWLCHYAPADYSRPIQDPSSAANAQFNELLRRWAKGSPDLLIYSYVSKSMWWRLPRPVMHTFAADVKYLHSLGIHRYYCQSLLVDWAHDGPLYYVMARLLWDPSADPDAVAAEWTRCMFGKAAGPMSEFYAAVEDAMHRTGHSFSDNPVRQVPGLFDPAGLERAQARLDAAKAAADTPQTVDRVRYVADCFAYGVHMIRAIEARARFLEDSAPTNLREAVAEAEEALTFCRVKDAEEFLDSIRVNDEMGVMAQSFGPAMELGGRRCWNSDESGPGDNANGWASFLIEVAAPTKPVRLEMDVWGKSDLRSISVNTSGDGKGNAAGGVWTPVRPDKPVSGKEQWETLAFNIAPAVMAPGKKAQRIGFGGADSQVWVARVRVSEAGAR